MNPTAKEKIVLVAHGASQTDAWSVPYIVTITKAGQPLSFDEAKDYMKTGKGPQFSGTSFGEFGALSDSDCKALFGKSVPNTAEIQDTGLRLGGTTTGSKIYALRNGAHWSFGELIVKTFGKYDKVTMLACRN